MRYRVLILTVAILAFIRAGSGASTRPMTMDSLVRESELVIYGRALASRSVWDPATETIWTQTEFAVLDGAKGNPARTVMVSEPGGIIGDVGHLFPGVPRFDSGQEVVLFLYRTPANRLRVSGLMQGVYKVEQDRRSGEKSVRPAILKPEEVYEEGKGAPRSLSVGTSSHRLGEFLSSIRERASRR